MKKYALERFSDEYYRVINQNGVKQALPKQEGNEKFNACWDGACAPDGTFYFTLSSEGGMSDHAKLVRYDREKNEIVDCFYSGDYLLPNIRQLPHSKFHTSINFRPTDNKCGYEVVATTHSTDKTPFHPEWMPFGHHNHVWEGFPGSQILVYDPDTGHVKSLGTPVHHESIYGARYDPKHDRLYMIGFMRGHVYSYDFKTKKVEDLGKAAELYNYRLALGADGNIYGCTKSGYLYRVNTEKNCLEDMGFEMPDEPGHYIHNTWYKYLLAWHNDPSGKFMYWKTLSSDYMMRLDFETGEVSRAGRIVPGDGVVPFPSEHSDNECDTFCVDKYGVIWYQYRVWQMDSRLDYRYTEPNYLMRWDIKNGCEPEVLGIIGTPEYTQNLTTEMDYDEANDCIYCVNVGRGFGEKGPHITCIDLKVFREHMYEKGPKVQEKEYYPVDLTEEEKKARDVRLAKKATGEEVTEHNPFQAFPIENVRPVRIWRKVPRDQIEESKVIGMAWDDEDILHVVTGASPDAPRYIIRIRGDEVRGRLDYALVKPEYRDWLAANMLPRPVDALPEDIRLPEATGRRYRAKACATAKWHDGRTFVGTLDALCALVSDSGDVYALGNAAAYGPIRCVCTNAARTKLWGVAGDDEDMGYVFTYDDEEGLRQLGILNYNTHGYFSGPTASNVLSSIALSPDEKTLAIGGADRIATVHIVTL